MTFGFNELHERALAAAGVLVADPWSLIRRDLTTRSGQPTL
jgi:hypothetical protein